MKNLTIKALLLAAGYGTRLGSVTKDTPKCLVEIGGEKLLETWIKNLLKIDAHTILINTHYLSEKVENFLSSRFNENNRIQTVYEENLLGTAGTLLKNIQYFKNSIGLLIHADNFTNIDLVPFLEAHINKPKDCLLSMITFNCEKPENCGIVEINKDSVVTNFFEKIPNPPSNRANGAIYAFDDEFIAWISENRNLTDFSTDVIPKLLGRIYAWHTEELFVDIGTPKSLKNVRALFN